MSLPVSIASDIQRLAPGGIIEFYVIDATAIGGSVFRWVPAVNEIGTQVVWAGESYAPFPIQASGFKRTGQGSQPQPKVQVANVGGAVGAACMELDDLIGAKFIRKRTMTKYLDAVNFPGGVNPQADPHAAWPDEIWFVNRKASENPIFVEFELAAAMDVSGTKLPRRPIVANVCAWDEYRGPECGYSGPPVADANDKPVTDLALDRCGRRVSSCKLRFGEFAELPIGCFPGAALIR